MVQFMAHFFPDCVIRVRPSRIFSWLFLISNHMIFLVQIVINKHL